jgi:hypothetical protein
MNAPPVLYTSVTMGYSDSEDRLWLRLVDGAHEAKFWLSRRIALPMLERSYELLTQAQDRGEARQSHQSAVKEFLERKGDRPPPPNREVASGPAMGLVASIDITVSEQGARWVFSSPVSGTAAFQADRTQAHQLLEVLWSKVREARWSEQAPWSSQDPAT